MLCAAFHNCLALCGGTELFKIAHLDRPIESMHNRIGQPPIQIEINPSELGQLAGRRQAFGRGRGGEGASLLSESELLRAMFDVGYFPPNTPPLFANSNGRA